MIRTDTAVVFQKINRQRTLKFSLILFFKKWIFCLEEFFGWKFMVALGRTSTSCLPSHLYPHLLCLDRHCLLYLSASQMQKRWQSSAVTIHCSSLCLCVASSGGCLADGWRPFLYLSIIRSILKARFPQSVCTGCQLSLSAHYIFKYALACFLWSCPSCLGVGPLNILRYRINLLWDPLANLLCVSASKNEFWHANTSSYNSGQHCFVVLLYSSLPTLLSTGVLCLVYNLLRAKIVYLLHPVSGSRCFGITTSY